MISQGELRNLIEYNPETGMWRWRVVRRNHKTGWFAGALTPNGYLTIRIDGKTYYAHRLAWFWVHGEWPKITDHRDRDKANNRLDNLRLATKSKNAVNAKRRTDNVSGYVGVSWNDLRSKWQARIVRDGVLYSRLFADDKAASEWYMRRRTELFGDFSPVVSPDE